MSIPPPLTERVLERLPGPRGFWVLLWAASSFLIYELTRRFTHLPTYPRQEHALFGTVNASAGLNPGRHGPSSRSLLRGKSVQKGG